MCRSFPDACAVEAAWSQRGYCCMLLSAYIGNSTKIEYRNNMQISILVLLTLWSSLTAAQIPSGCECPLDCVCSVSSGSIDCSEADLRFVPVEVNSCEWPGITTLDLSGNFIGTVHSYAFSQLVNITSLYLYDNQISQIEDNAFVGLESLELLFLDGNRIESLSRLVFRSLRKLTKLLLYSNLLTNLPYGIFSEQKALTQLALYDNRLSSLRTEVFDDVTTLEELYLHENLISDLSHAPFRSLVRLRLLYLNDNRLSFISRFSFLGLAKLYLLILSRNTISVIENDTFNPTGSLQYLYLESNGLTYVNRLMFAGPTQLISLHLYANEITRISDGAFFRLNKLQKLSLHSNHISNIRKETFVGMDSLQDLVLYNNQLRNLTRDSFAQLTNLQRLWLYGNLITCMEPSTFKGLKNLQTLQLSSNRISYIPDELFQHTPNLLYLFLYDNNIASVGNTPFKHLPRLVQLSVYFNPIEYMAAGALDGTNSLYYLQWSDFGEDNHLVCDCSALWLYEWMIARPLQSSVVCAEPAQYNGVDLRALQRASFGCSGAVLSVDVGPDCDYHVVPRGGCLRLTCSSSPRGVVVWSRLDGDEIRRKPNTCSSNPAPSTCSQGGGGDGVLIVEGVESEDGGYYLCTAQFHNITRSQICRVIIGEPPTVDRPPASVVLVSPGPAVSFSLSFSGSPRPTVTWYRVSPMGSSRLLSEEGSQSRYFVSGEGSLVIRQTVVEDQGTYRAEVRNGAGLVSVVAQLSFYYPNSCRRDCLNGGQCVQLPVCSCPEGYFGRQCEENTETDLPTKAPPTTTPPVTTTEDDASGSGGFEDFIDYDDYDNSTSGDGDGGNKGMENVNGLIDDEDYGGEEMGGAMGGATHTRRKREDETNEELLTVSHKPRSKLSDASAQYEYHETFDPYQNIPKSK